MQNTSNDLHFYEWPGGLWSVAGRTRTHIKVKRSWQKELTINPGECPFCNGEGHVIYTFSDEWLLLENKFTLYPFHRLVIPPSCWAPSSLRLLGGKKNIHTALSRVTQQIAQGPKEKLVAAVHIGTDAGQNIGHLHWHVIQYMFQDTPPSTLCSEWKKIFAHNPQLILWEDKSFTVGVGGVKAGQCHILPQKDLSLSSLTNIVDKLIMLFNNKFQCPDFSFGFFVDAEKKFRYGIYTPILNHWGGAEQIALYETPPCPIPLPWPHEATVLYLKGRINP